MWISAKYSRTGSMLMLAVLFATTLSVFSLTYFRVARETKNSDFRSEQSEIARKISRIAHAEAFAQLEKAGCDEKSQIFWLLLGSVSGLETEIKLPFARQNAGKMLPPGYSCEFTCNARVVSFVNNGPDGKKYANRHEGHGIIALKIATTITNERGSLSRSVTHRLEVHHDYLVAAMVDSDEFGSKLKKVFLARKDLAFYDQTTFAGDQATLIASQAEMLPHKKPPVNLLLYHNFALWARRQMTVADLHRLQILCADKKIIDISGINHCGDSIELNGDWQVRGKGVLIADSFIINGAITRVASDSLLVLYARKGNIRVGTEKKIEAGLIAINRNYNGVVEATRPLHLYGLIIADRLNLNSWSPGTHRIFYDPAFLAPEKSYQMSFSPWINFRASSFK